MALIKSIGVYCGSSAGRNESYTKDAIRLSEIFIEHQIRLINGGGSIGLMGVMADAMLARGGQAVGVIPIGLKEKEVAHLGMTELIVTPDMHSRKLTIVNLSDAFIALPGGFGTLDEVFETLTWAQLRLHQKPIIIYNPDDYYDALIAQADKMVEEGFLHHHSRTLLMDTDDLDQILPMLQSFKSPKAEKWFAKGEE